MQHRCDSSLPDIPNLSFHVPAVAKLSSHKLLSHTLSMTVVICQERLLLLEMQTTQYWAAYCVAFWHPAISIHNLTILYGVVVHFVHYRTVQ